jgi:hypothetical protein
VVEQALQSICERMQRVAYESARLARGNGEFHGGTGDAPQLITATKGNAWAEPLQPAYPQPYAEMRVSLPSEVAPTIEMGEYYNERETVYTNAKHFQLGSVIETETEEPPLPVTEQPSEVKRGSDKLKRSRTAKGSVFGTIADAAGRGDSGPKAVFADANAMKEKVRMAVMVQEYNVCDFYWDTGLCQTIARSQIFEYLTLGVIGFNALWISIDTDHNDALTLADASPIFQIAENAFCVYFTFEWWVRFCSFKDKRNCIKDAWFCFDTCLVAIMVAETWILNLIMMLVGGGGGGALGNASVLKLFRLVRLTRMARMAKLLRAIPELIILIKGIAVASRSVVFTLLLLVVILYFFAIVFRQLTDDSEVGLEFFPSVPAAMNSLLLDGVLPDQAAIIRSCIDDSWILGMLILLFVLLATLTVMNMLVGVLCEVVSVVSSVEKEELTVNYVKMRLMTLFRGADADKSMTINKEEFSELLVGKKEAALIIREIGVDVVGLVDFADSLFEEQAELSFGTFMELLLSLRGSNTSTVKDIIDLRKFILTNLKLEMGNTRKEIVRELDKRFRPGGANYQGYPARKSLTAPSLAVAQPRPLDAEGGRNAQMQPQHHIPSPQKLPSEGRPATPTLKDVRKVLLNQPSAVQRRPNSGPTYSNNQKRPFEQPRAQSANSRSRRWDGPAPALPGFPNQLPSDEEEIIQGNGYDMYHNGAGDRSLRVGTRNMRPETR